MCAAHSPRPSPHLFRASVLGCRIRSLPALSLVVCNSRREIPGNDLPPTRLFATNAARVFQLVNQLMKTIALHSPVIHSLFRPAAIALLITATVASADDSQTASASVTNASPALGE